MPLLPARWIRTAPARRIASAALAAALLFAMSAASSASAATAPAPPDLAERGWVWPVAPVRIVAPWVAPAHEYGPGHRGIDLAHGAGAEVKAPAPGVVAFAGAVAGRGVITLDHGDGLVTTLEPVETALAPGTVVARGDPVGMVSTGGHAAPGTVHFGVRWDGAYINPMLLLGGIPRAVLLPCC